MGMISTGEADWAALCALAGGGPATAPADADAASWALYAPIAAPPRQPFVLAQVGQSLDGRIATVSGDSRYVSGPEAIVHLHRCRALVDAVVVGVGTVIADDPRLTVRHVPGRHPARVVIDPQGRLPAGAGVLRDDGCRRIVVQARPVPRPPGVETLTIGAEGGAIPPAAIVRELARLGLVRLLVEGGARTIAAFLAAGLVDRLHVGVAPIIIGAGPVGLSLPPVDRLDRALRPATRVYRLGADVLFDCALVRTAP